MLRVPECFLCGVEDELERHHVNWHHWDDRPENVVKLCGRCHKALHRVGGINTVEQLEEVRHSVWERKNLTQV